VEIELTENPEKAFQPKIGYQPNLDLNFEQGDWKIE
jgi:hypothetical protein